jgi:hypothetical protein
VSEDAEARAAELLTELRAAAPPHREELASAVVQRARWQRHVRHLLVSVGAAAGGMSSGLAHLLRR